MRSRLASLAATILIVTSSIPAPSTPSRIIAQAPLPTLVGEHLGSLNTADSQVLIVASQCDPSNVSWFAYLATGVATGPYEGTFTEFGVVEIPAQWWICCWLLEGGEPAIWNAVFTINSPTGQVLGIRSNVGSTISRIGHCWNWAVTGYMATASTQYEATIWSASDTLIDQGLIGSSVAKNWGGRSDNNFFEETFGAP